MCTSRADHKSKKLSSWSVTFSYSSQQWIISKLDCDGKTHKSGLYMTTRLATGTRKSSKAFPKSHLHHKESWSLFGGLLPIWSTTASWILVKPLHLRNMLSKWMRCTKNWNACSWHWSERTRCFYLTIPDWTLHNQHFKSWTNWGIKFCLTHLIHLTSHQLTTTFSSTLTAFFRENDSTTNTMQKMLSKSWSNPKTWIFRLHE